MRDAVTMSPVRSISVIWMAQGEDGFGALHAVPCCGDVELVADLLAADSLDDSGRDRPASRQGLVVRRNSCLLVR